jgi:hypothetical protein
VAYFDPISNYTIETLRQNSSTLKPIEPKQFDFCAATGDKIEFDHKLDAFILSLNVLLSIRFNSLVFPDSVLLNGKPIIERRIQSREDDLKLFDDADMALNETQLKKRQNKYRHIAEEADREVQRLTDFVGHCQKDQRKLEEEIETMENSRVIIDESN